jgi:phospholipid/cholesterol/gamma-HCH transport system substrate-binding protein
MNQTRFEWRVGLFVCIGLALLVVLLLMFSKGVSLRPTYTVRLKAESAGTLKKKAGVLMAGVPVGSVSEIHLEPDGRTVTIFLRIRSDSVIHSDARFVIEQSGFLGDQYVAIIPTDNQSPLLKDGDEVTAETPFNLQEAARDASGFLRRINETVSDVRRLALNETTLSNLSVGVASFRQFSEEALAMSTNINSLFMTNAEPISASISNIHVFSDQLAQMGVTLTNLLAEVQAGRGVAGNLVKNEKLASDLEQLVANLSIASSNLNRYGLWRMLWKRSEPAKPKK